ncbi:hypothetical protein ACFFJ0_23585 [Sphingobium scionense]|uniref:Uncharacterized protein n=2 Tax=Sphingobium scionense TaxID=1404341 RepID=A0A7W6LRT8_9SPHN|nr:hypothetical protein [Sphingobium scionense]MBB4148982.1 hypothetical protein [Sphingobium scionense]
MKRKSNIWTRIVDYVASQNAEFERSDGPVDDERWLADRDRWRQTKYLAYAMGLILTFSALTLISE